MECASESQENDDPKIFFHDSFDQEMQNRDNNANLNSPEACTEILPLEEKKLAESDVLSRGATVTGSIARDRDLCRLCLKNSISTIFIPCGKSFLFYCTGIDRFASAHVVACHECSFPSKNNAIKRCPFCSSTVDTIFKVYQ
jgi:hypothetical protein